MTPTSPASAVAGTYTIEVEDPRTAGSWKFYNTFNLYIPIDVMLCSFTVRYTGSAVLLQWETENEDGLAGFGVERAQGREEWRMIVSFADCPELAARSTEGRKKYRYVGQSVQHGASYRYGWLRSAWTVKLCTMRR